MSQLFTNNASGTLSVQAEIIDTTLTLQTNEGQLYPTPTGGDFFQCTLEDTAGNIEIVQCTGRATDVLTVVRAQESTTAKVFPTGSRAELRPTADHSAFLQVSGGVMTGELDMNNNLLTDPLLTGGQIRNSPIRGTDGGTANEIIVPTAGGVPTLGGNKIFHAGNDGAGSGLDADFLDGDSSAIFARLADDEVITGDYLLDGDVTTAGQGTGGRIKDGDDDIQPIGFNVMPYLLTNISFTFDLSQIGQLFHRDQTGAMDWFLPDLSALPAGATWAINNTGASGIFRLKGVTGVTVKHLDGATGTVTTVVGGNGFTLDVGAVVTVYKVVNTTYHIWGSGISVSP